MDCECDGTSYSSPVTPPSDVHGCGVMIEANDSRLVCEPDDAKHFVDKLEEMIETHGMTLVKPLTLTESMLWLWGLHLPGFVGRHKEELKSLKTPVEALTFYQSQPDNGMLMENGMRCPALFPPHMVRVWCAPMALPCPDADDY